MGTRYTVAGDDPGMLEVTWQGPEGVRCALVDEFTVRLEWCGVKVEAMPPKREGEGLCAYSEDRADLGVSDMAWAELGRQALRALYVRRAEVTRRVPSRYRAQG